MACHSPHTKKEIIDSMAHYDQLLEKMDTDSIALLYAADGELGTAAKGRDSIRNFLKTFSTYRVLSNTSTTDSVSLMNDSAFQLGRYKQVTILPSKDTARLSGQFEAYWIWIPEEGWRIRKMTTAPDKN
jgi:hypothetical protein